MAVPRPGGPDVGWGLLSVGRLLVPLPEKWRSLLWLVTDACRHSVLSRVHN